MMLEEHKINKILLKILNLILIFVITMKITNLNNSWWRPLRKQIVNG